MKYLNKFASVFLFAALGVFALTSCEGSDLYKVGAPSQRKNWWVRWKMCITLEKKICPLPSLR